MRNLMFALLASSISAISPTAVAASVRTAAQTLADAAPDQETFHELYAPAALTDEDDLEEQDETRRNRIAELTRAAQGVASTDAKRASVLYELAKLHQERAFYLRDLAVESYKDDYDKWWIGENFAEPALKLDGWKEEMLKSINVLRDLAANFRKDPRSAEVHWLIAASMARLGNDHCEQYFKMATQLAKTPEWSTKIRVSQADWLVASGKIDAAIAAYADLRTNGPEDVKPYATYRLGWALLSKGLKGTDKERGELTKKAEAALKLAFLAVKKDQDTRFKLRAEAANDLAWLWAVTDNDKEAATFFEKHDLKKMIAVFKDKQADEWLRRGQPDKAAAYFQTKMTADPEDPKRPDQYLKLAYAYVVAGNVAALKQTTDALSKITTDKEDPWFDEHEDDKALMSRAKRMLATLPMVSGLKLFQAAETQKDEKRKKEMLTAAIKSLQEQLRSIKNDEQALSIRVMLVRGFIALNQHLEALNLLDAIVKMGSKAGPQLAGAAYERLNIIVKLDADQQYPAVPEPGEVKSPLPLPELKRRFAAAAEDYVSIVQDAEILPNLRFQIANDLFTYGHYDDALSRFESFAMTYPRHEQARTAIEVCLSMNLKRKNWEELVRLSTAFLNNRNVKGKELRQYIKENLDWAREKVKEADGSATVH